MNKPQPPFSEEMEKSVLCVFLSDAEKFEDTVRTRLPLEAFYIPAHRTVAEAMLWLVGHRKPVNFHTVKAQLIALGQLEDCGGVDLLNSLVDFVPGSVGMDHYISIVRGKWMLRTTMNCMKDMYAKCAESDAQWVDMKLQVETMLLNISRDGEVEDKSLHEITLEWSNDLDKRLERINSRGFRLGIEDVDLKLGPSVPGELVIIGSESSGGKTALAMQGALASAQKGISVAVFSLEMMNEQLWDRMFSHMAKIPMSKWRHPAFEAEDFTRIHNQAVKFVNLPLYINQRRRIDLAALSSKARRLKVSHNIGALVVDYIQRVRGTGKNKDKRYLEIAEISDELKQLALELGIVVIAPCQLNKQGQERESSDIRNDADRFFIIRDGELWIEKDRQNKRLYSLPIQFNGDFVTFEDGPPPMEDKKSNRRNGSRPVVHRSSSDD